MTDKPEALLIADNLGKSWTLLSDQVKAAAELRWLHAENETLRAGEAFHKVAVQQRDAAWRERDAAELMSLALKAQRDELLHALKLAWPILEGEKFRQECSYGSNFHQHRADRARVAYERAKSVFAKIGESV